MAAAAAPARRIVRRERVTWVYVNGSKDGPVVHCARCLKTQLMGRRLEELLADGPAFLAAHRDCEERP